MTLKMRTPEEMKAYVEGYNACNKQFRECLKNRKSVVDAVKKMDVFVVAVSAVIDKEVENADSN